MSVLPADFSADRTFPWPLRSYPGKRPLDVALALAALVARKDALKGRKVAVIVCGGNVSQQVIDSIQ